eukprot:m.75594 g.75594  ORF g.75594 m.75594 type:complete len:414 (+) comp14590_c0_seq1:191-1432(+)
MAASALGRVLGSRAMRQASSQLFSRGISSSVSVSASSPVTALPRTVFQGKHAERMAALSQLAQQTNAPLQSLVEQYEREVFALDRVPQIPEGPTQERMAALSRSFEQRGVDVSQSPALVVAVNVSDGADATLKRISQIFEAGIDGILLADLSQPSRPDQPVAERVACLANTYKAARAAFPNKWIGGSLTQVRPSAPEFFPLVKSTLPGVDGLLIDSPLILPFKPQTSAFDVAADGSGAAAAIHTLKLEWATLADCAAAQAFLAAQQQHNVATLLLGSVASNSFALIHPHMHLHLHDVTDSTGNTAPPPNAAMQQFVRHWARMAANVFHVVVSSGPDLDTDISEAKLACLADNARPLGLWRGQPNGQLKPARHEKILQTANILLAWEEHSATEENAVDESWLNLFVLANRFHKE